MIEISASSISLTLAIIAIGGTIFGIFFYFQKPQIALEKRVAKGEDEVKDLQKQLSLMRDDHSKSTEVMQKEIKDLTSAVNLLNITVAKLSTMIDERIPKGSPSLTPAGT